MSDKNRPLQPPVSQAHNLRQQADRIIEEFNRAWAERRNPLATDYAPSDLALCELVFPELQRLEVAYQRDAMLATVSKVGAGGMETVSHIPASVDDTDFLDSDKQRKLPIDAPLGPGSILGDYKILDVLGKGGMGIVYRALQIRAGRIVALKVIQGKKLGDQEIIKRFESEARAAARVEHENLVTVYDVGKVEGHHYYSMQLIRGESLADMLGRGPVGARIAARYVEQAARGLQAAHAVGILHRDIKPSNILVESVRDKSLVADFGLAKLQETNHELTQSGQVFGTPAYMAPEQALDAATVNAAADVYSLGATLFHLLVGRPPFQAKSLPELLRLVIESESPRLRELNSKIDRDLDTICLKCLEKDPQRRYGTAEELANDLGRYLRHEPIKARRISLPARCFRWMKRKPATTGLLAAMVSAVMLAGVAWTMAERAEVFRARQQLDEELREQLAQEPLHAGYVREVEQILKRMHTLDASWSEKQATRFKESYQAYLNRAVQKVQLVDEEIERLLRAVEGYARLDPQAAAPLLESLRARQREWRNVAVLKQPFETLASVFAPEKVTVSPDAQDRLRLAADGQSDVACQTILQGTMNFEMEVTFAEGWEAGRKLGVGFAPLSSSGEPQAMLYECVLTASLNAFWSENRGPSFNRARSEHSNPELFFIREHRFLERQDIAWSDLPPGAITLRARRDGARLTMQINDLKPFTVEEVFSGDSSTEGLFAVNWPQGAELTALRVSAPMKAAPETSLDDANRLFTQGAFAAAMEKYSRILTQSVESSTVHEATFRHAACLLDLKRFAEAEEQLMNLALLEAPPWSLRAAFLLWLTHLRAEQHDKSYDLADFIFARFPGEKFSEIRAGERIAEAIPYSWRNEIYERLPAGYNRNSGRPPADAEEILDKTEKCYVMLACSAFERRRIYYALLIDMLDAGQSQRALEYCRLLEAESGVSTEDLVSTLEEHVHILNTEGHTDEAMKLLNTYLERPPIKGSSWYFRLLIYRAALFGTQERWLEAKQDLTAFFEHDFAPRHATLHAYVLSGFIEERLNDSERARSQWRKGLAFLRAMLADQPPDELLTSSAYTPMLGSLGESFSDEDIDRISSSFVGNVTWTKLVKPLFPKNMLYEVPRVAWSTPQGKMWAKKIALLQVSTSDMWSITSKVPMREAWRQTVCGSSAFDSEISSDLDLVLDAMVDLHFDYFFTLAVDRVETLMLFQSWNGQTGILGWQSLAPRIPDTLRPYLEFLLGCEYRNQGRADDSRKFLEAALAHSPADTPLRWCIELELANPKGTMPPRRWFAEGLQDGSMATRAVAARKGGRFSLHLRASADQPNHVRSRQLVAIQPDRTYLLSGWIKTNGITGGGSTTPPATAQIAVSNGIEVTSGLSGDNDWTYVAVLINSRDRESITICTGLGSPESPAMGEAWFDDLTLVELVEPGPFDPAAGKFLQPTYLTAALRARNLLINSSFEE